jgi:hypothetical protein
MNFDPCSTIVRERGLLPDSIGESNVAVYLGTYHVYELKDTKDKLDDLMQDLTPLQLSDHKMKHAMFHLSNHNKYFCRLIVMPRTFNQSGMLLWLSVS